MSGSDVVRTTAARLGEVLGDMALPCAERLCGYVLRCSRSELYLNATTEPTEEQQQAIDHIIRRCRNHEPLDYILGTAYFYHREFTVTPAVLLPRPDTEVLVEQVLARENDQPLRFADIGTGSGIIACILTEERPQWGGVGIDCFEAALRVARTNLRSDRVVLVGGDVLTALKRGFRFDFIVSNPPYIPSAEVGRLDSSVRDYEPRGALDGGSDGLDFYRRIACDAPEYLCPGGRVYGEIGYDQENAVREIFSSERWSDVTCIRDLAGHPRVISATSEHGEMSNEK